MLNKSFYPITTIISYLFFLTISIITNTLMGHITIFIFLLIVILISNMDISILFKKISKLKYVLFFLFLFNLIFKVSFYENSIMLLKIIELFIYTNILKNIINIKQFNYGINNLFSFLKIFNINPKVISFSLTLTIQFIPIIINKCKTILKSLKSKGISIKDATFSNKLLILKSIIVPIIIQSIDVSDKMDMALECNLYDINEPSTNYETYSFSFIDFCFILIHLCLLFILLKGRLL